MPVADVSQAMLDRDDAAVGRGMHIRVGEGISEEALGWREPLSEGARMSAGRHHGQGMMRHQAGELFRVALPHQECGPVEGMEPQVGQTLMLSTPQGQQIPARVDSIDDEKVTFDLNHPLAGQSLTFTIEVVGINETATQQHAGCGPDCSSGGCGCGDSGCC